MPAGCSIFSSSCSSIVAVEHLSGIRVLVILFLDPGICIGDVAVEEVLSVVGVGFQIGLLDFVADELRIARSQFDLDESPDSGPRFPGRELLALRTACSMTYIRCTGSAAISSVSWLKVSDRTLKAKRVEIPVMPSLTPAASRYSCRSTWPSDRCPSGFHRHRRAAWNRAWSSRVRAARVRTLKRAIMLAMSPGRTGRLCERALAEQLAVDLLLPRSPAGNRAP